MARLIAKIAPGRTAPDIKATHLLTGPDGQYVYQFDTVDEAKKACEILSASPDVLYAEPDLFVTMCSASPEHFTVTAASSSPWCLSWGAGRIGAGDFMSHLIATGKQRTAVTVAVVDTGLDPSHRYFTNRHVTGRNFVNLSASTMDDHNHGTHTSGTIIDVTNQLDGVKIMPIKVLDSTGSGASINVANGVSWAVTNGARVINMSLGGSMSQVMDEAVVSAIRRGVTVVVSAGNSAMDANSFCPAHIGDAITVSAVDRFDGPASFTNFGSCVDVAAPGVDILSSIRHGKTGVMDGTSMASPHVAGAVAMLLQHNPSASPAIVKSLICSNVDSIATNSTTYYGKGILNLRKLLPIGIISVEMALARGETQQLVATVRPTTAINTYVTWYSSNNRVASVSTSGLVTAGRSLIGGTAIITAKTVNGCTANYKIMVNGIGKLCLRCGQIMQIVSCAKCGESYTVCRCPQFAHVCKRVCLICGGNHVTGACLKLFKRPVVEPVVGPGPLVQKVIAEADIGKHLNDGWAFKLQLQSGSVIMEKAIDIENITKEVLEQADKQIVNITTQADVENITQEVLDQVNKQITDAIAKEKQRLLEK